MLAVVAVTFVVAVAALVWAVLHDRRLFPQVERCTLTAASSATYELTPEQAGNAATISAVALRRGVGERGATVALATALQESKLRNLNRGDRDSLGLFQQRPSQGWGTAAQVRDPVHASEKFYAALVKIHGWQQLPLTQAAQQVQRSGFPDAYAAHEDEAAALAAALSGRRQAALSCRVNDHDLPRERLTSSGLTPRAARVLAQVERAYGRQSLAGFAPGGGTPGAAPESAHAEGRGIDFRFRPVDAAHRARGWSTAQFLVANAGALHLATVSYDRRTWTAGRSSDGWRANPAGSDGPDLTADLDHVHVEVVRGS